MEKDAQQVAVPPFLRKRLQAFRVGKGEQQSYLIIDQIDEKQFELEPWQFFILQILPGCEDFNKLAAIFMDRFGHSITNKEVENLFSLVTDKKLFALSASSHPLLEAFNKKRDARPAEENSPETLVQDALPNNNSSSTQTPSEDQKPTTAENNTQGINDDKKPLPAGVCDALGLDNRIPSKLWELFNPTPYIKRCYPWLLPLKYTIYLLPVLLIPALIISVRYINFIVEDFTLLRENMSFAAHVLIGMATDNLLIVLATSLVAYAYRGTVNSVCFVLLMGFFPRFIVRISHADQFTRRERIWLHAAPLLARLGLISVCIFIWLTTRAHYGFLAKSGLVVAVLTMGSFFLCINPLIKNSGYHLLAAFLNEPSLRTKAYMALMNRLRGNVYKKTDANTLTAYALASALFMIITFTVFTFLFGRFLNTHLGGASLFLIGFIILAMSLNISKKFKEINQAYESSVQFQRWRTRTIPEADNEVAAPENKNNLIIYLKRALFLIILVVLFVPYNYEVSGVFDILPNEQQHITAEIGGIIDEIYFDGGETLKKDTKIGRLSYSDYTDQIEVLAAKMQEQQSVIDELKSKPRPEEVQLAERGLEVEQTRAQFSGEKAIRLEELYKKRTISFEDLEDARREHEVDLSQIEEKRANLELIKAGAPPDQIAAEEAKLQSLEKECDHNLNKIEQSIFRMPFDGKLVTLNLKQMVGTYLDKGALLCIVENTDLVNAQIEVFESDIGYILKSEKVRIRPHAYYNEDEDFTGEVSKIDAKITDVHTGKVIKVITTIKNKDGRLKTGMTGFAKISCGYLPTWKVLSLGIFHFINVEAWSWLP